MIDPKNPESIVNRWDFLPGVYVPITPPKISAKSLLKRVKKSKRRRQE